MSRCSTSTERHWRSSRCTFVPLNASMTTDPQDVVTASTTENSNTPQPCNCPRCTLPPKQPTPRSVRKTEHLLQVYASSAFNTCEHQPLPIMSGKPFRLMITPDATPTAHHKVPLHWQEEVKAGLDRDVRLGVLEKVPVGMAVTWCHHIRGVARIWKEGRQRNLCPLLHPFK